MKSRIVLCMFAASIFARADFSYTSAREGATNEPATKHYLKGQKLMTDSGRSATIIDFDAQTITTINHAAKTYSVRKFSDMPSTIPADIQADVKSTGQKKTINGFSASEVLMNMQIEANSGRGPMKMQMEVHVWVSPDVPGAQELRAFYKRNLNKFPWAGLLQSNSGMQKGMADLQRKMADLDGVPVLETVKMGGMPGMSDAQAAQMAQARARLEEMQKQGGPQAQAAAQALARMGAMSGAGGMEITTESANFSTAAIPDSTFAIPAGYAQANR